MGLNHGKISKSVQMLLGTWWGSGRRVWFDVCVCARACVVCVRVCVHGRVHVLLVVGKLIQDVTSRVHVTYMHAIVSQV